MGRCLPWRSADLDAGDASFVGIAHQELEPELEDPSADRWHTPKVGDDEPTYGVEIVIFR